MEKYLGAAVLFVIFLGHCSCNCPGGTYGYNCGYTCNCDQDKCNPTSGCSPPNCSPGWSGPTCQKHNLARVKPTSSSGEGLYPSSQATDGNTAANSYAFCIETKGSNPNWWRVDLNDTVLIRDVTIYFRTDYTPRRNGIQVYLTNTTTIPSGLLCYTVTGRVDGPDINNTTSFPCHGRGRYVLLYTTTANNRDTQPIMDFCEVEVNACDPGTFGADCENYCHCKDGVCNDITGVCPPGGCLAGWKGTNCDVECVDNVEYGPDCRGACSSRMCQGDGSTCPRDTGRCTDGCQAGWKGRTALQPVSKVWNTGSGVSKPAVPGCAREMGAPVPGIQDGVMEDVRQDGGVDCRQECQSRTFGVNCSSTCGHCVDDEPCHHVTRTCLKGCSPGWVSDTCQQVSSLPGNSTGRISPLVAGFIGAVVMLVLLAVVAGAVCSWRKGDFRMAKTSSKEPGTPQTSPAPPVEVSTYDVLPEHDYTKLDTIHTEHYDTLQTTVDYQNSDVRI
ncbi:multiple epidermal growth factor-like domains protein 11 isoform X4 [Haliotis rubra]|uniref:multiple epidermal growth factor-like domains protein 11 isoform X4 n=1 Tax=Haliotis rubra TaxID=36100 RepID=UPI001EE58DAB|nr:multiple epidermal growth factor-like domains protein 11 isoform X4 [Haliotis rubra]